MSIYMIEGINDDKIDNPALAVKADDLWTVDFFVPGVPSPGGSKKSFHHAKTGKIITMDDAKNNRGWKERVSAFADANGLGVPLSGPLLLDVTFTLPRPRGHYGTGKHRERLKPSAPRHHETRPDTTKLLRACEDALKGIIYADDSQIVIQTAMKVYGNVPGVRVRVRRLEP